MDSCASYLCRFSVSVRSSTNELFSNIVQNLEPEKHKRIREQGKKWLVQMSFIWYISSIRCYYTKSAVQYVKWKSQVININFLNATMVAIVAYLGKMLQSLPSSNYSPCTSKDHVERSQYWETHVWDGLIHEMELHFSIWIILTFETWLKRGSINLSIR